MDYFYQKVDANNMRKWEATGDYNKQDLLTEKSNNTTTMALSNAIKNIVLKGNVKNKIASDLDTTLTDRNDQIDDLLDLINNTSEELVFDKIIE